MQLALTDEQQMIQDMMQDINLHSCNLAVKKHSENHAKK